MTTEIMIFAMHNSTDKYAIIIDGRLGLYDSQIDAANVYALIGGYNDSDGLAETPFGSCQFLPPNYRCTGCLHDDHGDIADHVADATDIETYIRDAQSK